MSLLEVKNLNLSFDGQAVVKNVSFNVQSGEVHGLIGESGSGKSLTAMSIVKLLPASCHVDTGEIMFQREEGQVDILKLGKKQLQKIRGSEIGFVFQDPMTAMNPVMKCGFTTMKSGDTAHDKPNRIGFTGLCPICRL